MKMILIMMILMLILMMITTILMLIMMTKPYDYNDDIDDDQAHKNDSYTAAGAVPGDCVPCSFVPVPLFRFLCSGSFVLVPLSRPFGRIYATFGRSRAAFGRLLVPGRSRTPTPPRGKTGIVFLGGGEQRLL